MAPLCTPYDVGRRLGVDYDTAEIVQVSAICDDVSGLIRARRPQVDTWLANGLLDANLVVAIACQVVARQLTTISTGGVGLRGETHPEYSYELTASAAAGLNLSKAELTALTPQGARPGAFSIQPR